jgi:RimJ/RimL family protein N-acetyltransferase
VRRHLARSREHASELIAARRVKVAGVVAQKPATGVTTDVAIVVAEDPDRPDYVSRGGHKLAGALAAFAPRGLDVRGRRVLDAGASTGGFTDVLLRHGAAEVVAVDVGYGQLAWRLRQDERVRVHDRTNIRELDAETIGGPVDVVVGDLSFLEPPDRDRIAMITCGIAPSCRGNGYATEMLRALVPWLRARTDIRGIRADTDLVNPSSHQVLRAAGLRVVQDDGDRQLYEMRWDHAERIPRSLPPRRP